MALYRCSECGLVTCLMPKLCANSKQARHDKFIREAQERINRTYEKADAKKANRKEKGA